MVYFTYHAIYGDHGLITGVRLDKRIEALETELAALRPTRLNLENRSARMRAATLDMDLLEEQARHLLSVAHPREIVIFREVDDKRSNPE